MNQNRIELEQRAEHRYSKVLLRSSTPVASIENLEENNAERKRLGDRDGDGLVKFWDSESVVNAPIEGF